MHKVILIICTIFLLSFTGHHDKCCTKSFGKCTGSKYCTACKNCNYCKYCSVRGHTCGVCARKK